MFSICLKKRNYTNYIQHLSWTRPIMVSENRLRYKEWLQNSITLLWQRWLKMVGKQGKCAVHRSTCSYLELRGIQKPYTNAKSGSHGEELFNLIERRSSIESCRQSMFAGTERISFFRVDSKIGFPSCSCQS